MTLGRREGRRAHEASEAARRMAARPQGDRVGSSNATTGSSRCSRSLRSCWPACAATVRSRTSAASTRSPEDALLRLARQAARGRRTRSSQVATKRELEKKVAEPEGETYELAVVGEAMRGWECKEARRPVPPTRRPRAQGPGGGARHAGLPPGRSTGPRSAGANPTDSARMAAALTSRELQRP